MSTNKEHPQPPPYPGNEMNNPVGGSQTNYGFQQPGQQQPPPQYGFAGQPPQGYAGQPQHGYAGQPQQGFAPQPAFHSQMNNVVVTQVGMGGGPVYQSAPQDYTTQAFIACLCCFWPTGIIAIMKASESRDAVARGDMVRAHEAANGARQMVRISYIVGIISVVFAAVIIGVYFAVFINAYNSYDY